MVQISHFITILFISSVLTLSNQLFAEEIEEQVLRSATKEKKIDFSLRLGQGGFQDDRSPIDKLGGGQLALDIKPNIFPVAISISNEYYTNSAEPTHSYEISNLTALIYYI